MKLVRRKSGFGCGLCGWWLKRGDTTLIGVYWEPEDDRYATGRFSAPWRPFRLTYWKAGIVLLDRTVWRWKRHANRYGRVAFG